MLLLLVFLLLVFLLLRQAGSACGARTHDDIDVDDDDLCGLVADVQDEGVEGSLDGGQLGWSGA